MLRMAPFAGRRDNIPKGRPKAPRQEVIDNGVDRGAQIEEDTCKQGMEEGRKKCKYLAKAWEFWDRLSWKEWGVQDTH